MIMNDGDDKKEEHHQVSLINGLVNVLRWSN